MGVLLVIEPLIPEKTGALQQQHFASTFGHLSHSIEGKPQNELKADSLNYIVHPPVAWEEVVKHTTRIQTQKRNCDIERIQSMPSSCKDIRAELASCLQASDCVMVYRNKPGDCLRPPLRDTLPTQCQQLQKSYAACRKGWLDMRKRFRGNRPISVSQEIEADASGKSYQLYAGKPAFTSVKGTDGREHEKPSPLDDDDDSDE